MWHAEIENLLRSAIGLDANTIGRPAIEQAVRHRMAKHGFRQMGQYCEKVRSSEAELQELVEVVVVPETWFFRHREAFVALASLVVKEWLPTHSYGLLRLLCIGCSTGEEPYSIVIALLEAGLPPERFQVNALDISSQALAAAKSAVFYEKSFREGDLSFRERYFRPTREGYQLVESVRELVRFQQHNFLAEDFLGGTEAYDIVFCRNVIIYLERTAREQVLNSLDRLVVPDGVLFLGPADTFVTISSNFKSLGHPVVFGFRKCSTMPPESLPASPPRKKGDIKNLASRSHKPSSVIKTKTRFPATSKKDPLPAPTAPGTRLSNLELARRLADAGRLVEASELCQSYLKEQGPSAPAYFLLGLALDGLGDSMQAGDCYRKALYLEPDYLEVLIHFALLSEKRGDHLSAQRLRARARRVEERHKP
ncbi:MAG: protein-glutamate O-methyltransferase CheR [Terriglobia bacterium]